MKRKAALTSDLLVAMRTSSSLTTSSQMEHMGPADTEGDVGAATAVGSGPSATAE